MKKITTKEARDLRIEMDFYDPDNIFREAYNLAVTRHNERKIAKRHSPIDESVDDINHRIDRIDRLEKADIATANAIKEVWSSIEKLEHFVKCQGVSNRVDIEEMCGFNARLEGIETRLKIINGS